MDIYQIKTGMYAGRYLLAKFDEERQQYTSTDLTARQARIQSPGYCYTYGGTPAALASEGIRTYATLAAARNANSVQP